MKSSKPGKRVWIALSALSASAALAVAVAAPASAGVPSAVITGKSAPSGIKVSLFATNTDAQNVPASAGANSFHSNIHDLAIADGKVFAGYGDYNANTGPVNLNSYSIATGAEKHEITGIPGEEIGKLKLLDGAVYAPNIDPRVSWTSPANYGRYDPATHAGSYIANTPFIHVFDVAKLGSELFMAGSIVNPDKTVYGPTNTLAAIKKSVDGGATWTIDRTAADDPVVLSTYPGDGEYARYYWLAVSGGKLYTRASTMSSTGDPSLAFTYPGTDGVQHTAYNTPGLDVYTPGSGWSAIDAGPTIATLPHPYHADAVGSKIIFAMSSFRGVTGSVTVNGQTTAVPVFDTSTSTYGSLNAPGVYSVLDTYQDGTTSYILANSPVAPSIYSSTDGSTWTKLADVIMPAYYDAKSIAVSNGIAYIGSSKANIYKLALPGGSSTAGGKR